RVSTPPQDPVATGLRLSRHRAALTELPLLISEHPLQGRPVHLVMTALHRDGRRAEAPAAYRDLRHRLLAKWGVEPGSALRQLSQRLVQEDALNHLMMGTARRKSRRLNA
ncbi:BTAD domain-containing putative transcriptional regulator, partial [Nonomuraea fuscirosea]